MKRRIIAVVVASMLALAFFAGCGGTGHGEGDTPHTTELVGEWNFQGSLYYTFNADGTGSMLGTPGSIRWSTSNGILSVCATPGLCGAVVDCSTPQNWAYSFAGDTLTLVGQGSGPIFGGTFQYTRR